MRMTLADKFVYYQKLFMREEKMLTKHLWG